MRLGGVFKAWFKLTLLHYGKVFCNLLFAISFGNKPLRSPFFKWESLINYSESCCKYLDIFLKKIHLKYSCHFAINLSCNLLIPNSKFSAFVGVPKKFEEFSVQNKFESTSNFFGLQQQSHLSIMLLIFQELEQAQFKIFNI